MAEAGEERVLFIPADTRSKAQLENALMMAEAKFGPLCGVFANAGIQRSNTLLDIDTGELDLLIDINIKGTVNTLQATVPRLISNGGGSVVINASDQSKIGKRRSFGYGLTKGALGQIAKSLALDLADKNIRVNAVCPATIYTPLVERAFERARLRTGLSLARIEADECADHPMGRMGRPEEVAMAVEFLLSSKSSFMTGALVSIDGGLTAQ